MKKALLAIVATTLIATNALAKDIVDTAVDIVADNGVIHVIDTVIMPN